MDYTDFSVEDFVMDAAFQDWVRHPSDESAAFWENWLRDHPHKAGEIDRARMIVLGIDFKRTPVDKVPRELMLRRIRNTIAGMEHVRVQPTPALNRVYYRAAAAFLAVVVSTATLYFITAPETKSYSTSFGEISKIALPDGSQMVLNANSSVRFEDDWNEREAREVWLEGEAFFDVRHLDNHQRFVVKTDRLDVEVLGTEFNVQTRRRRVQVVLNSGLVKLNKKGSEGKELYMRPGDLVELSAQRDELVRRVVNPADYSAWRNNELIFKATPLGDIAETLNANYGWEITFEDESMKTYEFTGTVSTDSMAKVEMLLVTISEAFGFEVQKDKNRIMFKKTR